MSGLTPKELIDSRLVSLTEVLSEVDRASLNDLRDLVNGAEFQHGNDALRVLDKSSFDDLHRKQLRALVLRVIAQLHVNAALRINKSAEAKTRKTDSRYFLRRGIELSSEALMLDPSNQHGWETLGVCYALTGRKKLCTMAFERAMVGADRETAMSAHRQQEIFAAIPMVHPDIRAFLISLLILWLSLMFPVLLLFTIPYAVFRGFRLSKMKDIPEVFRTT